ncbi:MAG: Transglutaminase-like superfamily protein [Acidobacteria bacterium ADurb.Bin340]|nr:MAG: Transglutaminase-like superfamily protein [Acidobacteria bacterium ADurb.Bin340]HQL47318.1 transglutaminase-like domain-containing protein [Holophaga sp.]
MPLRLLLLCSLLASAAFGSAPQRFRLWMAGQEVGGREIRVTEEGAARRVEILEWSRLVRLGTAIDTEVRQTLTRHEHGRIEITWHLRMGADPMEGTARWSLEDPRRIAHQAQGSALRWIDLPEGALLWPETLEDRLRQAAARQEPVTLAGFSAPLGQATELSLTPSGPAPLPGFPDAVRFRGRSREGAMAGEVELWISPRHGMLKEESSLGGIPVRLQRAELPEGAPSDNGTAFFERTLAPLPAHPFLSWLPEATLRWEGRGSQDLPEDPQQARVGPNRYRVRRAALPTPEEASEPPAQPPFRADEAPFLVHSALLQFRDPAFDGLVARLRPRPGATRWELAQAVTRFVFAWIDDKDFSVGFATALEVARRPKGDCTEHAVLAAALLRRLGVPARGVTGWVAAGRTFGLHLWVEVKLRDRWIPVDPTFDEAPASALHLKLGTSDLGDLGSVGWDTAATQVAEGRWAPDPGWPAVAAPEGERLALPGGGALRLEGGRWRRDGATLTALLGGSQELEAVSRPPLAHLEGATVLEEPAAGRRAWWLPQRQEAYLRLADQRWMRARCRNLAQVHRLLEKLSYVP